MIKKIKTILVTGGAGFIGSHAVICLLNEGYDVVIFDNFCNSSRIVIDRLEDISNQKITCIEGDILNEVDLYKVFNNHAVDAVMHFAGLKAVGESVQDPLSYYNSNVTGTLNLLNIMQSFNIYNIVFSSSATVYGEPQYVPIDENHPTQEPTNPYGKTKLIIEGILKDLSDSNKKWAIANLRYFNPIGAHLSGKIGEDPQGPPNNIMPYITKVAVGQHSSLSIFGNDYPTKDGTGVRDYIHVIDLVEGHVRALEFLNGNNGFYVWNLGSGKGYSVLELLSAFQQCSGINIPKVISPRRHGDVAECWSNPDKALKELGWKSKHDLYQMIKDSWNWQSKNPHGYKNP